MSNTKHTPGPWSINHRRWTNSAGSAVIDIDAPKANIESLASIYSGHKKIDDETEANAKLTAAAPELLDSLDKAPDPYAFKKMRGYLEAYDMWMAISKIPAIKKATE